MQNIEYMEKREIKINKINFIKALNIALEEKKQICTNSISRVFGIRKNGEEIEIESILIKIG